MCLGLGGLLSAIPPISPASAPTITCTQVLTGGCKAVCFKHPRYRIYRQTPKTDGGMGDACTQSQGA